ncbi:hypothetical protein GCM10027044_02440 [Hymenobacter ruber]
MHGGVGGGAAQQGHNIHRVAYLCVDYALPTGGAMAGSHIVRTAALIRVYRERTPKNRHHLSGTHAAPHPLHICCRDAGRHIAPNPKD